MHCFTTLVLRAQLVRVSPFVVVDNGSRATKGTKANCVSYSYDIIAVHKLLHNRIFKTLSSVFANCHRALQDRINNSPLQMRKFPSKKHDTSFRELGKIKQIKNFLYASWNDGFDRFHSSLSLKRPNFSQLSPRLVKGGSFSSL